MANPSQESVPLTSKDIVDSINMFKIPTTKRSIEILTSLPSANDRLTILQFIVLMTYRIENPDPIIQQALDALDESLLGFEEELGAHSPVSD